MKDLQHITIQIAGQAPIGLDVPKERVKWMHNVERSVNRLWAKWCNDFHTKSPQEVLAMVTFQYARYYYDLLDNINANEASLLEFEKKLDEILLDIK